MSRFASDDHRFVRRVRVGVAVVAATGVVFGSAAVIGATATAVPAASSASQGEPSAGGAAASEGGQDATGAVSSPKGPLSPRLQEIAAAKPKSTSALTSAVAAAGLPDSGPGSLMRGPGVSVEAIIRVAAISDKTRAALEAAGAQITVVSSDTSSYSAYVAPKALTAVTAVSGVIAVSEVLQGRFSGAGLRAAVPHKVAAAGAQPCPTTISLADTQMKAALARTNFGVDGTGIKVGVLSNSYARQTSPTSAAQDVASGNLPGPGNPCGRTIPVQVIADNIPSGQGDEDEGRSMLQLVHRVAPGATLMFATAGVGGLQGFAENIRALQAAGANVIVDDYGPWDEVQFQDGILDKAIRDVTALGVTYLSAAGNENFQWGGNDAGSIELDSYITTTCPTVVANTFPTPIDCMDFDPSGTPSSTAWYTIPSGESFGALMSYSEPLYGVTDDLDLYLMDNLGNTFMSASTGDNIGTGNPTEVVSYFNQTMSDVTVKLVVSRTKGTGMPRVGFIQPNSGDYSAAQYTNSSGPRTIGTNSILGHAGGTYTLSVAATDGSGPGTTPEGFSSAGPVTRYWAPFTTAATPATAIPVMVLNKPDFTATDNDCVTFVPFAGSPGPATCPYKFSGTSGAAPEAAGVVALMLSRNRALGFAQVQSILAASAAPMSGGSIISTGAGLVDANAALALTPLPPSPTPTPTPVPTPTPNPLPAVLADLCPSGSCVGANLAGVNLAGANLAGVDFTGVNFTGANLSGANLTGANLTGAILSGGTRARSLAGRATLAANLTGANLTRANLTGVHAANVRFVHANLRHANLRKANLRKANLRKADLRKADLRKADLRKADLRKADLRHAKLHKANLKGAKR